MVRFLNQFSRWSERNTDQQNEYLERLFRSFLAACSSLPKDAFINKRNRRFNIALYEAAFTATSEGAFEKKRELQGNVAASDIASLENDTEFVDASIQGTTQTANVETRLKRTRMLVRPL
jgi:uncharacterized protein with ParB-like and HNH nuclease domain